MELFASSRCVYAVSSREAGAGYALAGLRSAPPIVVLGANFTDQDLVQPVHTLGGKRFLYEFGKAITQGSLLGVALLGYASASGLASFVNSIRISRNHGGVSLSTPMGGYKVHVTGFGLSTPDAEYNMQPFTIPFHLA